MVSSYAQSGKLFEERRAANVRQITVATTTHGVAARFCKDAPSYGTPQARNAATDPDVDWLNRVPPSAQRAAHPVVVEAPSDDIPMSQLTDDNNSQNSGSQNNNHNHSTGFMPNNRPPYNVSARQGVQSTARFQPSATPIRQPPASRFGHLTTPRHQQQQQRTKQQHRGLASSPRANISIGSSSVSYQPRSMIKKTTPRPWNPQQQHGTGPSSTPLTPMRSASTNQTKTSTPFLLSQSSLTTSIDSSRSVGQAGGRFSFSRTAMLDTSNVQLNSHASSRSSIAAFQASSDKLVEAQMQVMEDRAKVLQEIIFKAQTSAIADVKAMKIEAAIEIEEACKTQVHEIEERASELQAENAQQAKETFETQRVQLVDRCLPMLREKATSILTNLIQGPSVLKMVEQLFKRSKYSIKNEPSPSYSCVPDKSTFSRRSTPTKTRTNRINVTTSSNKVTTSVKPKLKPVQSKIVSTKKVVTNTKKATTKNTDIKATLSKVVTTKQSVKRKGTEVKKAPSPPRRSKRKAAKLSKSTAVDLSDEEEEFNHRLSPIVSTLPTKERKIVGSCIMTPSETIRRQITQSTSSKPSKRVEEDDRMPIRIVEWTKPNPETKRKRKRLFGRVFNDNTDSVSSPMLSQVVVPSQKKHKSSKSRARTVPSVQVRSKAGLRHRKKSTVKRSLVVEDVGGCFDFHF